jgi:hypothetical protein
MGPVGYGHDAGVEGRRYQEDAGPRRGLPRQGVHQPAPRRSGAPLASSPHLRTQTCTCCPVLHGAHESCDKWPAFSRTLSAASAVRDGQTRVLRNHWWRFSIDSACRMTRACTHTCWAVSPQKPRSWMLSEASRRQNRLRGSRGRCVGRARELLYPYARVWRVCAHAYNGFNYK